MISEIDEIPIDRQSTPAIVRDPRGAWISVLVALITVRRARIHIFVIA